MKKTTTILFSILILLFFWGTAEGQSQIYIEDFEDGIVGYTTSVPETTNGSDDYFIRTDGSNISATLSNIQGSSFFAAQDIDGLGGPSQQTLTFDDINIAGYENLELRVYLAEDNASDIAEDWDAPDFVHFDYDINNSGSYSNLLWIENDGSSSNSAPYIDTDFDGTGDGTEITDTFVQYTRNITETGSTLDLRIVFDLDDGDTDIAIDNVEIWGTATGGTPTQLAITEINGGNSPSVGTPFDVVVQAQDGSGTASNVSSDVDVNIRFNTGNGSLGGTLSGTISSGNNQTTISGVTYDTAESGVIIEVADDASNLTTGTSPSFEVLEAASQLIFSNVPSDGIVGSPLSSFTAEAQRSDNSIDLNYSKSITLSIVSGSGTLGGTVTKTAVDGVVTFDDITINDNGDHTLEATDGTLTSSPSSTISIIEVNIILNEFLADPPTGTDPNGDGSPDTGEDEFIEFVNTGDSDLDITGWTIEEEGGLAHTFPSTVLSPNQPVVIFSGGSADGYFGGAIAQISTAGFALNNTGDSIILKNDSEIEIINYSYGSEGGNDQSITRSQDLTGEFTAHSSADPDGSNFSPGLRVDGFSFLPTIQITGNEGWRMFSSPTSNNSFDDLLGPIWTQGSTTGANHPGGDPNVLTYDGSAFNAVDDLTSTMNEGEGFLVFIYSDDDYTDSGADNGFPKVLEMSGTENAGSVSPSINEGSSNTATLVGNPYLSPIDWDELTKENLTNTVYVYDDSYGAPSSPDEEASGVAGSYRVWNGASGSLDHGQIAPFQGFWVLYDGSGSASLTIEEADKTVGGMFFKHQQDEAISIRLKAETGTMFNETFFTFNEEGQLGLDHFDGLELTPLDHGDYLSLATETEGTLLDINNLQLQFSEAIELPLHVNAYQAVDEGWTTVGSEVTLTWPELNNIPSGWKITLTDKQSGRTINLKTSDSYTFTLKQSASKIAAKKPFHPFLQNPIRKEKAPQQNRFILSIDPANDNLTDNFIPNQYSLEQNYPNPFNPSTNINYEIADLTDVELSVFNVMGQRVSTLVNGTKAPGSYQVTWDASDFASGIYYYRLNVSGVVFTRQMTLIK